MFDTILRMFRRQPARQYVRGRERRGYERVRVRTEVSVMAHGQVRKGQVSDVSITGACLSVDLPLQIGDSVRIVADQLPLPILTKVVRLADDNYGLAFSDSGVALIFVGWSRGADVGGGRG